jgi:hypothetical protein
MTELLCSWERAMFDGSSVILARARSDAPRPAATVPWQLVLLLMCFATLSVALAMLYPNVFGMPFEQF